MPRKGRGGPRSGNPGTAYANRTDLAADTQPVAVPTGQTYGEAGRQESAMRQMGLPDLQAKIASMPGLLDESQRPDEPLTAGLPFGEGPGPAQMSNGGNDVDLLREMYRMFPTEELRRMIERLDRQAGLGR